MHGIAVGPSDFEYIHLKGDGDVVLYQRGFASPQEYQDWEDYGDYGNYNPTAVEGSDGTNRITTKDLGGFFFGGGGDDHITYQMGGGQYYNVYAGQAELHGDDGNDTLEINFAASSSSLSVNGLTGSITGRLSGYFSIGVNSTFDTFENLHMFGGSASDNFIGGTGSDRLNTGAGNDILVGSAGKDILTGGAGSDMFLFAAGDSGVGGANRDYITDFESGADKIELSGASAVRFSEVGGRALVAADMDGDGRFELQISVGFGAGHSFADFTANDILII